MRCFVPILAFTASLKRKLRGSLGLETQQAGVAILGWGITKHFHPSCSNAMSL